METNEVFFDGNAKNLYAFHRDDGGTLTRPPLKYSAPAGDAVVVDFSRDAGRRDTEGACDFPVAVST